jgi:2-keto-4-pentenoate hydratase/2-oxohepta-3-ene-1,7-dioic acid hydratase in catechol pathway
VIIPRGGTKLDWEVELAVVIGRVARYVDRRISASERTSPATRCTTILRARLSARARRPVGEGKSADTFAPLGPFLATRDELPDISAGDVARRQRQPRQRGTTANMVVGVPALVSYVSQFMTLLPATSSARHARRRRDSG